MRISKTAFKEYARCPRVFPLEQIYLKKMDVEGLFNNDEMERRLELLGLMFDSEDGEDLLLESDPQIEVMLPFYREVEKWAIRYADRQFNREFISSPDTKKQKCFSFRDGAHSFYCYLDGYAENDQEIIIVEVKATTTRKFKDLGPKIKGKRDSIFEIKNNIYQLKHLKDAHQPSYEKLFDRYSDVGRYVYDLAVERFIVENSIIHNFPDLQSKKAFYYLAVLNSDYVFSGKYEAGEPQYDIDQNNNLITFIDLTATTAQYMPLLQKEKEKILKSLCKADPDPAVMDKYCEFFEPRKCFFSKVCFPNLFKKGAISEYMNSSFFTDESGQKHSRFSLINARKYHLLDIPKSWLHNPNQKIQRECFEEGKEYWDYQKINQALALIEYPIYHLDFESFPCPLPRFIGEGPYSQSLFQYSVHIEREPGQCDIIKDHYSFLATDFSDQREDLVRELIKLIDLKKGGTVLVYNKSFESNRLKELCRIYPQYRKELEIIIDHIFDLLDVVKTRAEMYKELGFSEEESKTVNYYHNDLGGLYSIKKVLPLFSDLTYKNLDIQKGTEAIAAYAKFKSLPQADIEDLREKLIKYCRQDTWAMVLILKQIRLRAEKKM
ncbi:MAG: DUF2779 domain-containing protein [Acholeplasmataceae bacterium]|nr:DUF2779 domain-containing protein [Acholeplasmataceae bacterium]